MGGGGGCAGAERRPPHCLCPVVLRLRRGEPVSGGPGGGRQPPGEPGRRGGPGAEHDRDPGEPGGGNGPFGAVLSGPSGLGFRLAAAERGRDLPLLQRPPGAPGSGVLQRGNWLCRGICPGGGQGGVERHSAAV